MSSSLSIYVLSIYILFYLTNGTHKNKFKRGFRYRGWGWTPNIPFQNHGYKDPRKINSGCNVTLKNATFNLGPLHLGHKSQLKYYTVDDERSETDPNDNYKYAFNVCGPVLEIPDGCRNESIMGEFCEDNNLDVNGTCIDEMKQVDGPVYAYQMKVDDQDKVTRCWHLSDTVGGPGVWSLLNEDNPSEGVTVSYLDGDYEIACGHNRQINISFVCDNDHGAFGIPGQARSEIDYSPESLTYHNMIDYSPEEKICQYKLEFHTVYGCPSDCPLVGGKLCNGVGLCGYDNTIRRARCYCLTYFGGSSCNQIDMTSIFKTKKDPITADLDSPFVHQFVHKLNGPHKKEHKINVVYDLSPFHTDSTKPYVLNDIDGITHTYVWNFMGELDFDTVIDANQSNKTLRDLGCWTSPVGYCIDLNGTCSKDSDLVAEEGYVYQVDFDKNECHIAGGRDVSWELYDEDNPARGVVLTYKNGEYCEGSNPFDDTKFKKNRQFKITLLCPDDSNEYIPLSDETQRIFDAYVEEDDFDFCNYHVSITTAFACPNECRTDATNTPDVDNDVSVCSAKGMCASDPFSGYVHCLCDNGWTGDYCDVPYVAPPMPVKYKNQGSYIAAIIIISVLLVAICYFGYKKINSQRQKVKELEIKLVNYQSSGGGLAMYNDERPPQLDAMPLAKPPSLGDKIKKKFSKNKKGNYANISSHNEDEADEAELFNVKVRMNGGHSDNDSEENDTDEHDEQQFKMNKVQHIIGDDDDDDSDDNEDDDEEDEDK